MASKYHLVIEWTGEKYRIHYRLPSDLGFTATVADEFTLAQDKRTVSQVNCELSADEVRRIISSALRNKE